MPPIPCMGMAFRSLYPPSISPDSQHMKDCRCLMQRDWSQRTYQDRCRLVGDKATGQTHCRQIFEVDVLGAHTPAMGPRPQGAHKERCTPNLQSCVQVHVDSGTLIPDLRNEVCNGPSCTLLRLLQCLAHTYASIAYPIGCNLQHSSLHGLTGEAPRKVAARFGNGPIAKGRHSALWAGSCVTHARSHVHMCGLRRAGAKHAHLEQSS